MASPSGAAAATKMRLLSEQEIADLKHAFAHGEKTASLTNRLGIPLYRLREIRRRWKQDGEIWQPTAKTPGRPPKLRSEEETALLRDFLDRNPQALIKEATDYLASNCGIDVDNSTVYRAMAREGWLSKKTRARERDDMGMWKPTLPRDENGNPLYGPTKDFGRVKRRRDPDGRTKQKAALDEKIFDRVDTFVKNYMSNPRFDASHDYAHVLRVVNLSKHILRAEANANPSTRYEPMIVLLSALLHDIDDHKYAPDDLQAPPISDPRSSQPSSSTEAEQSNVLDEDSAQLQVGRNCRTSVVANAPAAPPVHFPNDRTVHASEHLQPPDPAQEQPGHEVILERKTKSLSTHLHRLHVPRRFIPSICAICSAVSYTTEVSQPAYVASVLANHPELAVVQDADRLDALGAIGLGRAFTFGATKVPERGMQGTIEHMDEKLLRLEALMKTYEGKRLAGIRADRIRAFKGWWAEEMQEGITLEGGFMTEVLGSERDPRRSLWPRPLSDFNRGMPQAPARHNPVATTTVGDATAHTDGLLLPEIRMNGTGSSLRLAETIDHPNRQLMMEAGILR